MTVSKYDSTTGLTYTVATKEIGSNWNDSGFRHRVECSDGRVSGWAPFTQVAYLDNVASMTPYFVGGEKLVTRSITEALTFIAVGPSTGEDDPEDELIDSMQT